MAFDLEIWKNKVAEKLHDWKTRMDRAGVSSIYLFLSAVALYPIVEAARAGDLAAFTMLGTIGCTLVANQIQTWKDEVDGAKRLEVQVSQDEALREELDKVLEKLEVLPQAKEQLKETDREWFTQEIQKELGRLGSSVHYEIFKSSGAIAQDHSIAVGKGGVYIGIIYKVYQSLPGRPRLNKNDFKRILGEYLDWVQNAYDKARLYGLESLRTAQGQPIRRLADVFIPLTLRRFQPLRREEVEELLRDQGDLSSRTKAYLKLVEQKQTEGEETPLKALLTVNDRLAVIGGAGSGKSTVLAYMAASLADSAQTGKKVPFSLPKKHQALVPLLIPLRYYREYLSLCQQVPEERLKNPRAGTLAGYVPWYLIRRCPSLELSEDFFDRLLLGGGCLLMLDGLDEVANREERGRVKQQVENLINDIYPGNLIIVTARESGYRENAVFGDDFTRLDVQHLNDEQIQTLVENWCNKLYPGEEQTRSEELVSAIKEINARYVGKDLPPLISTPLMTTMVVSVKWGETELPRERAKLYEAAVRVILQAQYIQDDPARKELVEWGGSWEEQRDWLSTLAYEMQRGGQAAAAVTEERLREILKPIVPAPNLEKFIEAVRMRGGLFDERAELFQFTHLTFQEFLAARLLAKQRKEALSGLGEHIPNPWWRETLLLLYGFAQADFPPFAQEYLEWLST